MLSEEAKVKLQRRGLAVRLYSEFPSYASFNVISRTLEAVCQASMSANRYGTVHVVYQRGFFHPTEKRNRAIWQFTGDHIYVNCPYCDAICKTSSKDYHMELSRACVICRDDHHFWAFLSGFDGWMIGEMARRAASAKALHGDR
jgi:hypothetical protein